MSIASTDFQFILAASDGNIGAHWNWNPINFNDVLGGLGTAVTVTYGFPQVQPTHYAVEDPVAAGFVPFESGEQVFFAAALGLFSAVANISFVENGQQSDILFMEGSLTAFAGFSGYAYYPGFSVVTGLSGEVVSVDPTALAGDIWFLADPNGGGRNYEPGGARWGLVIHEIGHALGLSHPHEGAPLLDTAYDNKNYTVMSYNYLTPEEPETPMLLDVLALQYLYGANYSFNSGDTVYSFVEEQRILRTIWDGGGNDTLSIAGLSHGSVIDLTDGHFSKINTSSFELANGHDNVAIAFGAIIENAVGGSGADRLLGNASVNKLTGGAGNDSLLGGDEFDRFIFGTTGNGIDLIEDFSGGDGIQIAANIGLTSVSLGTGIAVSGFRVEVSVSGGQTTLWIDTNNVVGADIQINLTGTFDIGQFTIINESGIGPTILRGPIPNVLPTGNVTISGVAAYGKQLNASHTLADVDGMGPISYTWKANGEVIPEANASSYVLTFNDVGKLVTVEARYLDGRGALEVVSSSATPAVQAFVNLLGSTGADVLDGSSGDDSLVGAGGNDTLNGYLGADLLDAGAGADQVFGGVGNDSIYASSASGSFDLIDGGDGADSLALSIDVSTGSALTWRGLDSTGNATVAVARSNWAVQDIQQYLPSFITLLATSGADIVSIKSIETINLSVIGSPNDDLLLVYGNGAYRGGNGVDAVYANWSNTTENIVWVNTGSATAQLVNGSYFSEMERILLVSGSGNDVIRETGGLAVPSSGARDDDVHGGAGNDLIEMGAGRDALFGDSGNDTLDGGTDFDLMIGGTGDDIYYVDDAFENPGELANQGTDTVNTTVASYTFSNKINLENLLYIGFGSFVGTGNDAANIIVGGSGFDTLAGALGNDTLDGGAEDDTLIGGQGDDSLIGGTGIDTATYADAVSAVTASLAGIGSATGGAGTDTLSGIENLIGSAFNDSLTGSSVANRLEGGAGNDTLNGSTGADTMVGGVGDDQYTIDNALDVVTELASEGVDSITTALLAFNLATSGANVENIRFTAAAASAVTGVGNALNNILTASAGDDSLDAATGNDTVSYAFASAAVVASLTSRTATGGSGADALVNFENIIGSNYSDTLTGNTLANRLEGAGGADTLTGGAGADTLVGGSGSDQFVVDNAGDVVIETGSDALSGTDLVITSVSYTLADNVENLRLSGAGALNATGNALNNVLMAASGDNVLSGLGGFDTASYAFTAGAVSVSLAISGAQATGSSGTDTLISIENLTGSNYNDTLAGSMGDNTIEGGVGTDTLTYAAATGGVTVSLAAKTGTGSQGNDQILRIENLVGSGFDDIFTGASGANLVDAGGGNDFINGSAGNDTLLGGAGNDSLQGGAGQDSLTGGAGADSFVYKSVNESKPASLEWDFITDFNAAEGDKIDLSYLDANTTLAGNQAFTFIGAAALTGAGQVRYDAGTGMLYASTDADAAAEWAVQLVGMPAFLAADLIG